MKRIPIVLILVLVLAACAPSDGGGGGYATGGGGSATGGGGSATGGGGSATGGGGSATGGGGSATGGGGAYSTIFGRIVRGDSGKPYPKAYVRFGWLVNANDEREAHTVTDDGGRYRIQLPAGLYQVTAGDTCDLNAGFAIVGRAQDDNMITVPGTNEVDFVEGPITPGADIRGLC
ncbi:carboxypeptidase-like regulatory domain-containing protein [Frankia sp. Cas3]|uniref:carboxypeptidase-like regulatory domain-containing protein n=1 Tax=Frankia sp. Cas3 TaxID=3073926 RepID=UPI002AD5743B|nr:carboxypeptidase-like regulatory domain-containing protein [Frankia sp. Cas3]